MIGTTLAHFRVTAKLGEGGMGEVWRAEDTRLGREVAIKVLPERFTADPERLARFEREARVLASLSHPNIAAIHDVGEEDGRHFLVMELAPGETLAERIARGPLPLPEALPIARQVAEALEAAHERGIVHRDLKPANVKVDAEGRVKVLDFGLARALAAESASAAEIAHSPTMTYQATMAGVLLGTAAYMSPEQARGRPADKRSDIWALGVLLWEMLTGERLFAGETVSDTLAAVLRQAPDEAALPAATPPALRRLLRRCLERDPVRRLHDVADARLELEEALTEPLSSPAATAPPPVAGRGIRRLLPWGLALAALALAAAAWLLPRPPAVEPPPLLRASILPPPGVELDYSGRQPGPVAISPEGTRIVYAGRDTEGLRLWLQDLPSGRATPLAGTADGSYPFWSPGGDAIGFIADDKLKRLDLAGGTPVTLAPAPFGKGGSWNADDVIVYAPSYDSGILAISAAGGEPRELTTLDRERSENSHRFPVFLPDGERFVFLVRSAAAEGSRLAVGSLAGGPPRDLMSSPVNATYAAGRLLFLREGTLLAQPFDPEALALAGRPVPLAENVRLLPGAARGVFTAAAGTLVYQIGGAQLARSLAWYDRAGAVLATVGEPAIMYRPSIAPDGRRVVLSIDDGETGRDNLWVVDLERGQRSRLTFGDNAADEPTWGPLGESIYFRTRIAGGGFLDLFRMSADGGGEPELLLSSDGDKSVLSVAGDESSLLYRIATRDTAQDIFLLPLGGEDRTPRPFLATPADEGDAAISPDGRWVAYESDASGRAEIYLTSFPQPRARWQVSGSGGRRPKWNPSRGELLFQEGDDTLLAVAVDLAGEVPRIGVPETLFASERPFYDSWDVRGERILLVRLEAATGSEPLSLLQGWTRLVPEAP